MLSELEEQQGGQGGSGGRVGDEGRASRGGVEHTEGFRTVSEFNRTPWRVLSREVTSLGFSVGS